MQQKVTTKVSSKLFVLVLIVVALFATACNNTTTSTASSSATATVAPATSAVESAATDTPATESTTAVVAESAQEPATDSAAAAMTMTRLNLNTVTGDELLATIPDFGARMVREFQEYRPYVSIQEFRREIGKYVDDTQVAFYEQYVYVPIRVNDSDADTLMQIPNLDATAADALIAARPFDSNDTFLQKLAEVAPAVDATVAQGYLEAQ